MCADAVLMTLHFVQCPFSACGCGSPGTRQGDWRLRPLEITLVGRDIAACPHAPESWALVWGIAVVGVSYSATSLRSLTAYGVQPTSASRLCLPLPLSSFHHSRQPASRTASSFLPVHFARDEFCGACAGCFSDLRLFSSRDKP